MGTNLLTYYIGTYMIVYKSIELHELKPDNL